MTGPAQRGYVASAVEEYDVPGGSDPNYRAWEAFDGDTNSASGKGYWSSKAGAFNTSSPFQTLRSGGVFVTNVGGTDRTGLWIQLELPHKLKLNLVKYQYRSASSGLPRTGFVVGSNNGTTWEQIYAFENLTASSTTVAHSLTPSGSVSNIAYKYIRLIITHGGGGQYAAAQHIELYGTEENSSIPIQIGGGNIDKVANFRVYDKFIEEDQVNEIWNAQKEEFGRAKPQMVLQQGKLGIGTDAPQGSLSVADEPHAVEEFPPRGIPSTGPITPENSKVNIDGHGTFEVLYSISDPGHFNSATDNPLVLFDKNPNTGVYSQVNTYRLNSAGATGSAVGSGNPLADPAIYTGSNTHGDQTYKSLGGYGGIWYGLKFPYKVNLKKSHILPRGTGLTTTPNTAVFLGSEDGGVTWTKIGEFSGASWKQYEYNKYTLSHTKPINAVAIVVTHSNHNYAVNMGELKFFGTREQGQSVLHDGQLTLTKNLDVPRIGPPLDADDTPRRDRLVVEYNTSTNPTFEGAVRDTSGRGNDGVFYNGAYYDATEKALVFDGTNDYVRTNNLKAFVGDQAHTIGGWFKRTNTSTARQDWFAMGTPATGQTTAFSIYTSGDDTYAYGYNNDIYSTANQIPDTSWYHVMITFVGGVPNTTNKKVYINGVDVTSNFGNGTATQTQNFGSDSYLTLGIDLGLSSHPAAVKISNFKLYDTALTAQEVKTLYDMGRMGGEANPQPLHIAAPLYAPGTIVQVEQSIKRDDSSTSGTSASDIPGLGVTIHPKFGTSKILVSYQINMGGNYHMFLRVKRTQNGTTTYVGNGNASGNRPLASSYQSHVHNSHVNSMNMEILDPANGMDPITYQIQFWVAHTNYTAWINRATSNHNSIYGPGALSSSITVKEVCQ